MLHKSNKELADQVKASMFAKTHDTHDSLHTRTLSDKGKIRQRVEQDMASFSRRSVRF